MIIEAFFFLKKNGFEKFFGINVIHTPRFTTKPPGKPHGPWGLKLLRSKLVQ